MKKILLFCLVFPLTAAATSRKPTSLELIRTDYPPGELLQLCERGIAKAKERFDAIAQIPPSERTVANTLLALESASAEYGEQAAPLSFIGQVSKSEALRAESTQCDEKQSEFGVELMSRRDLYDAIRGQEPSSAAEKRLWKAWMKGFEESGLKLSAEKLAEVKALQQEISQLEIRFSKNLNEDASSETFTREELAGVPESLLSRFGRDGDRFVVTTKINDYLPLMENARLGDTRKRMMLAYQRRGGEENLQIFEKVMALRVQAAKLLGYANWADYKTSDRMAKNAATVSRFLSGLKEKLSKRRQSDFAQLLAFKKEQNPEAKALDAWDVSYIPNQIKKRDYQLDSERVRQFFPTEKVVRGMFRIYEKMLGLRFKQVAAARVWDESVKLYEVRDAARGNLIGYFFTDFFPRPGKYGHAAAFTLRQGRLLGNGSYQQPISAIVSNFTPGTEQTPSLMTHDEVETIFHEFGHVMHQVLTRAPYASLAGSGVKRDFVEAPSQMLEEWAWSPEVLRQISGHYQTKQKLPEELLRKLLAARDFNLGVFYARQLLYATYDITMHTASGPVDANATYRRLYREIMGIDDIEGGRFPATFGHIIGGYDAGYYGYLWSEVYAADMFTAFKGRVLSPAVGQRYRRAILEQGDMKDPDELLVEFLGRKPRQDAFFRKLGIQ